MIGSETSATNTSPSSTAPTIPNAKAANPVALPMGKDGSIQKTVARYGSNMSAWIRHCSFPCIPLPTYCSTRLTLSYALSILPPALIGKRRILHGKGYGKDGKAKTSRRFYLLVCIYFLGI
jgi:hypothetical protein